MDDTTKFPAPAARATDPATSHMAAKMAEKKCTETQVRAMISLKLNGPLTDFELARHTNMQQTSIGKRRGDCVKVGMVEMHTDEEGKPVRRRAPSGAWAQVWRITAKGEEYLASLK